MVALCCFHLHRSVVYLYCLNYLVNKCNIYTSIVLFDGQISTIEVHPCALPGGSGSSGFPETGDGVPKTRVLGLGLMKAPKTSGVRSFRWFFNES